MNTTLYTEGTRVRYIGAHTPSLKGKEGVVMPDTHSIPRSLCVKFDHESRSRFVALTNLEVVPK